MKYQRYKLKQKREELEWNKWGCTFLVLTDLLISLGKMADGPKQDQLEKIAEILGWQEEFFYEEEITML